MEFWIVLDKSNKLQLPVNPAKFSIEQGGDLKTVNINSLGEALMIGNLNLAAISLSCFFPAEKQSFAVVKNPKKPYDYVGQIQSFRNKKKPLTLVITQTPVNMKCAIDSFTYGEEDGSGDVYYTINFKQYRDLKVIKKNTTKKKKPKNNERGGAKKKPPKTYKAKAGETLPKIAKTVYGDKAKYKTLIQKNKLRASEVKNLKLEKAYTLKC